MGLAGITFYNAMDGCWYQLTLENGGNGSGNFGHAGRLGKVSGSAKVADFTERFKKSPTIEEIRKYIDKLVEEGTKFATLSPDWLIDIKGGRKKKDHLIFSSQYKYMSEVEKRRHNKYVAGLEELLACAEYTGSKPNKKEDKKQNIEKYHYFVTKVRFGEKIYDIVLNAEQYKGESEDKPQTVHLYDIIEIK